MDPITAAMALAQFAPKIVKWVSGSDKAAEAAGAVVALANEVTATKGPADAVQALQADPALVLQFRDKIEEREAELDKAFLADMQDARRRDVELRRVGDHNKRADFMVAMDVFGLVGTLVAMLVLGWFKAKHSDAITEGVFGALLAQLSTMASYFGLCLRDAHQFEFGSSRGSREKDVLIGSAGRG
jgi:hypothetical protein